MLLKAFEPDKINHFGHALENWPYKQFKYGDFDGPNNTYAGGLPYQPSGERSGAQCHEFERMQGQVSYKTSAV